MNELIDRHNRWYPAESRLPIDPRTGDYVLVNGRQLPPRRRWTLRWVLERFPVASSVTQAEARRPSEVGERVAAGVGERAGGDGPVMFPSAQAVFMIPNPIACDSPATSARSETSAIPGV